MTANDTNPRQAEKPSNSTLSRRDVISAVGGAGLGASTLGVTGSKQGRATTTSDRDALAAAPAGFDLALPLAAVEFDAETFDRARVSVDQLAERAGVAVTLALDGDATAGVRARLSLDAAGELGHALTVSPEQWGRYFVDATAGHAHAESVGVQAAAGDDLLETGRAELVSDEDTLLALDVDGDATASGGVLLTDRQAVRLGEQLLAAVRDQRNDDAISSLRV
jgi:hypothetical protein